MRFMGGRARRAARDETVATVLGLGQRDPSVVAAGVLAWLGLVVVACVLPAGWAHADGAERQDAAPAGGAVAELAEVCPGGGGVRDGVDVLEEGAQGGQGCPGWGGDVPLPAPGFVDDDEGEVVTAPPAVLEGSQKPGEATGGDPEDESLVRRGQEFDR